MNNKETNNILEQIRLRIRDDVWNQVWSKVAVQVRGDINPMVVVQVHTQTWEKIRRTVKDQVGFYVNGNS